MQSKALSKYPTASFRELLSISLPMALSLLSSYVLLLTDSIFLAHHSLEAFEGCAAAIGFYFLFQMLTNRFISTVQTFVGRAYGAKKEDEAVSYTWQMIWIALLSPLIIFPLSFLYGKSFFKGTPIETEAMTYLTYMLAGNVLLALEVALSSFYVGIGDSKRVLKTHLISHPINIALNYVLIFGVSSILPPLGIHGAAIGTLLAKSLSCFLLFKHFLSHFFPSRFQSAVCKFIPKRCIECFQVALPRAIGQGSVALTWNYISHIFIQSGGIDLLTITFGVTIFLPFLNDAVGVAVLTISSYLIGAQSWSLFPKLFRSIAFFIMGNAVIMAIPFIFFAPQIVHLFEKETFSLSETAILIKSSMMVWLNFVTNSIYIISFMMLTALKDMRFYLIVHLPLGTFPYYFAIYYLHQKPYWSSEFLWLITAIFPIFFSSIYFARVLQKLKSLQTQSYLQA